MAKQLTKSQVATLKVVGAVDAKGAIDWRKVATLIKFFLDLYLNRPESR